MASGPWVGAIASGAGITSQSNGWGCFQPDFLLPLDRMFLCSPARLILFFESSKFWPIAIFAAKMIVVFSGRASAGFLWEKGN